MKKSTCNPKYVIVFGLMFVMLFSLSACGDKTINKTLPDVAVGETFEITLDAHGGTAFVWSYEISPKAGMEFVSREFIPTNGDPDLIGGGQFEYTFKGNKAGKYEITFKLKEIGKSQATETIVYSVKVVG